MDSAYGHMMSIENTLLSMSVSSTNSLRTAHFMQAMFDTLANCRTKLHLPIGPYCGIGDPYKHENGQRIVTWLGSYRA